MSQSDYIKHLKLATVLKDQRELKPVLDSAEYTSYKEYAIANIVRNTALHYEELPLAGITNVFDMPLRDVSNCPIFTECLNTNNRVNRKQLLNVYVAPRPVANYTKQLPNNKCSACCYDVSINGMYNKKCNFFNRDFTKYSNYRMRKILCNCKKL
jgi:hypothetical protein